MSDQLRALGIELIEGYGTDQLALAPDIYVVGNVVSRARDAQDNAKYPLMEAVLDAGLPYTSGPQWLSEHVLQGRYVLPWPARMAKPPPRPCWRGYWTVRVGAGLSGRRVPQNFGVSARLGQAPNHPAIATPTVPATTPSALCLGLKRTSTTLLF